MIWRANIVPVRHSHEELAIPALACDIGPDALLCGLGLACHYQLCTLHTKHQTWLSLLVSQKILKKSTIVVWINSFFLLRTWIFSFKVSFLRTLKLSGIWQWPQVGSTDLSKKLCYVNAEQWKITCSMLSLWCWYLRHAEGGEGVCSWERWYVQSISIVLLGGVMSCVEACKGHMLSRELFSLVIRRRAIQKSCAVCLIGAFCKISFIRNYLGQFMKQMKVTLQ